jgi:5-methyltetrahydrofolate--homocysteine methyltransferase
VWTLLDAERALGTELTEAFQIVPEQSTAAIVIHHPQASYFNAAAVRDLVSA